MKIWDVCTYNGERDILKLHFEILNPYVDRFIVCEAKTTFSGYKKPLYFSEHERSFKKWWHKIDYYIINENYSFPEIELAEMSPNTKGAKHWKHEFLQKESIKKALIRSGVKDNDIVYIGDADEIWEPYEGKLPAKLKLRVYAYYLNNRSSEEFWGTLVSRYIDIRDSCLNHMRSDTTLRVNEARGWHFTSMGGIREVRRKLNDSYTNESYNTYEVQSLLPERLRKGVDYLGRPFEFHEETLEWPLYLQRNKEKFQHLLLPLQE